MGKEIREASGNNDVHYMHLDLASLQSVREFAEEVQSKYPAIHTLVCNAGVWMPMDKQAKTEDGFEVHAGVNHLGHFLLTSLLLGRLETSAPSRVVVVSSGLMNSGQLDLTAYDHWRNGRQVDPSKRTHAPSGYCDSKLMNALFTRELASRVAGKGVGAVCVCPGWCYSDLARHTGINFMKKVLWRSGSAAGVRHREAPHLRERRALAEGAEGPRRRQHRHYAGGKQVGSAPPTRGADRRGEGVRREEQLEFHRDVGLGLHQRGDRLPQHPHRNLPDSVAKANHRLWGL